MIIICSFCYIIISIICYFIGLIHLRQTVKQHASLDEMVDIQLDLCASVSQYRDVSRGVEVDIGLKIVSDVGICLWEGVVTLLSRNASTQKSGSHQASSKEEKFLSSKPFLKTCYRYIYLISLFNKGSDIFCMNSLHKIMIV